MVRYALILLAIPPLFLLKWSHEARSHYPLTLVLGTLVVYLAYGLVYRKSAPPDHRFWRLVFLGLAAGLGWWTNHLMVIYLLPVFFLLWVNEKKIIWRWPFLAAPGRFPAGQFAAAPLSFSATGSRAWGS